MIFEPGLGLTVSDYSGLLEEVASHGYIIIGVNPTYSASAVVFADGRVVNQSANGNIPDNASVLETKLIGDSLVTIWAEDMSFAMSGPAAHDNDQIRPCGFMDLTHIGVFGIPSAAQPLLKFVI